MDIQETHLYGLIFKDSLTKDSKGTKHMESDNYLPVNFMIIIPNK